MSRPTPKWSPQPDHGSAAIRRPSTAQALGKLSTTSSRVGRYRAAAHAPTRRQIAQIRMTNVTIGIKGTAAQIAVIARRP